MFNFSLKTWIIGVVASFIISVSAYYIHHYIVVVPAELEAQKEKNEELENNKTLELNNVETEAQSNINFYDKNITQTEINELQEPFTNEKNSTNDTNISLDWVFFKS